MIRFLAGMAVGAAVTGFMVALAALSSHDEAVRNYQVPSGYPPAPYLGGGDDGGISDPHGRRPVRSWSRVGWDGK